MGGFAVEAPGRGRLRVYLGAAPGVGKTYAMLDEARHRRSRGTDVVVGVVECHGRPRTEEMLDGLEVVPRRQLTHRGDAFTEMDVDAVIARRPRVALVDELAHTNVPGSRNAKRWRDVEEILDAGIDVISTVNVQHLESLNDVVESITGVAQHETVPDGVVRRADQVEFVDLTPEALRRRLAHGNVYPPAIAGAAPANCFRPGNLTALRELALLWVAGRVDEYLREHRHDHPIDATRPARERVVVALTGGPEGDTLIRRAARIAGRGPGGEVLAVHVARSNGPSGGCSADLARQRRLVDSLGGTFHPIVGDDVPGALLDFARGVNATQIVLGGSRRRPWQYVLGPGVGATVAARSGDIDTHIVTHEHIGRGRETTPKRSTTARGRAVTSWAVALLGPLIPAAVLVPMRGGVALPGDMLLFLALTVGVALFGGLWQAVAAAVVGSLLLDYYLTAPTHTLKIAAPGNMLSLVVFVVIALAVASVVDLAARRAQQAARNQAEADTLSFLAGSVLRGEEALPALLERVRQTFGVESVAVLQRDGPCASWARVDSIGPNPPTRPDKADVEVPVDQSLALVLSGRALPADTRRVLGAFAAQTALVLERRTLVAEAAEARRLGEGHSLDTALFAIVARDLRAPLAAIKAGASGLRSHEVDWARAERAELLATIEAGADRLDQLIGNLLDMSRLRMGTIEPLPSDVALDEVVPGAVARAAQTAVRVSVPDTLPTVRADGELLDRVMANLVENAVLHTPPDTPVVVVAKAVRDRIELRVVDRGPGLPDDAKDRVFEAFARHGDAPRSRGVGLGLAVARGFAEAMNGSLTAEDTPGGGLTMILTLPASTGPEPGGEPDRSHVRSTPVDGHRDVRARTESGGRDDENDAASSRRR
ncbi:ATP-binding protein [Embleya sp. NPDC005575]|uniref:ATP-binding protein n=1 Tax=Embleya sp. NPDC005575 TaxID=3156892 RepID=UPI0033BA6E18